MTARVSIAHDRLARVGAHAAFILITILTTAGLVLTAMASAPLGANGVGAIVMYAFPVVGILIARQRPSNRIAWLCLTVGLVWALEGALWGAALYGLARPGAVARPELLAAVGDAFVMSGLFLMATLLLLLFPDGHLPSPGWRWLAWLSVVGIAGAHVLGLIQPTTSGWGRPALENPIAVDALAALDGIFLALFLCVAASVVALVRRYQGATGAERLQLKWLMAAGVSAALVWLASILVVEPTAGENAAVVTSVSAFVLIPAAIGFAILRHRLYEIDLVINRALVYGALTALLAGAYAGLVLLLGLALSPLTERSDLAIAVSTLAVAALFRPARRRLQRIVDRRFYRHRYDAARTLTGFSSRLQAQTDLDALRAELTQVVSETMQPAHVSVWLRPERVPRAPSPRRPRSSSRPAGARTAE